MSEWVSDALAPNLLTGATLGSATTSNGTAVDIGSHPEVRFVLSSGTGTPSLTVDIQTSDVADFSDDVTTIATLNAVGANVKRDAITRIQRRYVRAAVTTAAASAAAVLRVETPFYRGDRDADSTKAIV